MGSPSDLHIAQPLTLKCGLTIPNRLVKAAMAEQLSDSQHLPNERLQAVYKPWAEGGWGMLITGIPHSHPSPIPPPNTNQMPRQRPSNNHAPRPAPRPRDSPHLLPVPPPLRHHPLLRRLGPRLPPLPLPFPQIFPQTRRDSPTQPPRPAIPPRRRRPPLLFVSHRPVTNPHLPRPDPAAHRGALAHVWRRAARNDAGRYR